MTHAKNIIAEISFLNQQICNLLKSHNFLKFGKKQ